jgi:hypothetical protein
MKQNRSRRECLALGAAGLMAAHSFPTFAQKPTAKRLSVAVVTGYTPVDYPHAPKPDLHAGPPERKN